MRIVIVFVESKHVLQKEIPEDSDFTSLKLVVVSDKEKAAHTIILHVYKSNT